MFYLILLFLLGVCNSSKPKLCINCRYFIPCDLSTSYSKCSQFPRSDITTNFLVSGNHDYVRSNYYYCSSAKDQGKICVVQMVLNIKKYILTKINLQK